MTLRGGVRWKRCGVLRTEGFDFRAVVRVTGALESAGSTLSDSTGTTVSESCAARAGCGAGTEWWIGACRALAGASHAAGGARGASVLDADLIALLPSLP